MDGVLCDFEKRFEDLTGLSPNAYRDENGNPKDWWVNENGEKVRLTYPGNLWEEFCVPFWSSKEVRSYAKTKKSLLWVRKYKMIAIVEKSHKCKGKPSCHLPLIIPSL